MGVMEHSGPQSQPAIDLTDVKPLGGLNGGDPSCPGSDEHGKVPEQCRPCQWFWKTRGCKHGNKCLFCHLCPAGELKERRKANRQLGRQQHLSQSSEGSSASSEDDQVVGATLSQGSTAPPEKQKSPESLERERRLQSNAAKYEKLSDEELIKLLPKDEAGRTTSIGAMLHASKQCGACTFLHFSKDQICILGMRCKFCHASHPKRDRRSNRTGPHTRQKKRKTLEQPHPDVDGGPAKKRLRVDASRSSELHWDDVLAAPLDWMGNSRPCWLEDQDLNEYRHLSAGGGVGQAIPAPAQHWPAPAAGYRPAAAAGYPPAGGHPYSGGHLPSWPPR